MPPVDVKYAALTIHSTVSPLACVGRRQDRLINPLARPVVSSQLSALPYVSLRARNCKNRLALAVINDRVCCEHAT